MNGRNNGSIALGKDELTYDEKLINSVTNRKNYFENLCEDEVLQRDVEAIQKFTNSLKDQVTEAIDELKKNLSVKDENEFLRILSCSFECLGWSHLIRRKYRSFPDMQKSNPF